MSILIEHLTKFKEDHKFSGKGSLCVALVVTQNARQKMPLNPRNLLTASGGQVLGLGRDAVQKILERHGISQVLASEGGRTSRGSIKNMEDYVDFLNKLSNNIEIEFDLVEKFWIERVKEFFSAKPFKINLDISYGFRALVRGIVAQAEERQRNNRGMKYVGAVIQHLVGAKLECALNSSVNIIHNSFSTSDAQLGRAGDFLIGNVAIHVTTAPTEALIERCRNNINQSYQPIIVTTARSVTAAEVLADNAGLGKRIDVFEIEQFIALNIYEISKFLISNQQNTVNDLVNKYNKIIKNVETDQSLRIEFR